MSVKSSQLLKQLKSRKTRLEVDLKELVTQLTELKRQQDKTANQLSSVSQEIKRLQSSDIIVSEHAILRYLERAKGLDIEAIKEEILSAIPQSY